MKTTLFSVYLPLQSTKRVFIDERGTKGVVRSRASNLDARLHKIAAKTRHLPRFLREYLGGARSIACCVLPGCVPSDVLAGFQIWAPGFDETTLQSQWLSL